MKTSPVADQVSNTFDWSEADEATLLQGVVKKDRRAWAEFLRRFKPAIDKRLKYIVGRCWRQFRSSDMLDDIKGEFFLSLVDNNMAKLRAYDSAKGTLVAWLSRLAKHAALNHIDTLTRRTDSVSLDDFERMEQRDHQRGAYWVAEGL